VTPEALECCDFLHICMITREFPPESGGIGYYVLNLSKNLLAMGHKVTVMTRGTTARFTKEIISGIDVFKIPFFPFYPLHIWIHGWFVNSIFKSLEPRFDLVHLHSPLPPPVKTELPTITTVHTSMKIDSKYHEVIDFFSFAEKMQSMLVYPAIEKNLLNNSKSITSVSLSVAKELSNYGINPQKITIVGNAVDEKEFTPIRSNVRSEKYVLYTGVLRARKGLFDLLECAEYVCKIYSDVKFLVCGTGPFSQNLREKVRVKKLERNVKFLGYVDRNKLVELYQNATVQVIPSHYEGLPTVLLEAMSCGLPVVATDVGGSSDVISTGVDGFLVPPKSPREMADVILKLLADKELRKKIGSNARKTIEKFYTWDNLANNMVECYQNLLRMT
jgi:glycosyltransferase involved in cell wall biosynthesis